LSEEKEGEEAEGEEMMSDRMKAAVATGNIFKLAELLDGWTTEELKVLLVDVNAYYEECMGRLHDKYGEMIFKPEVFFNPKAASLVNVASHEVEIGVLGTCSEISSVAMCILEERGIKFSDEGEIEV
jgi:hypothetical protein